jgi:hypothetical protein
MDFFEAVTLFVGKTVFLMVCIPNVHNGKILKGRKNGKTVEKTWWPQFFRFSIRPQLTRPYPSSQSLLSFSFRLFCICNCFALFIIISSSFFFLLPFDAVS